MSNIWKFRNLEIEMLKAQVTRKMIAKELGISYQSVGNKINNIKPFYREEMFKIKALLKTDMTLDDLFLLEKIEVKNDRL